MKTVNLRSLISGAILLSLIATTVGAGTVSLSVTAFGHKNEGEGDFDIVNYNAVCTGTGAPNLDVYCWDNTEDAYVLVDSIPASEGNNFEDFERGDSGDVPHDNNDFDIMVEMEDENGNDTDTVYYSHP